MAALLALENGLRATVRFMDKATSRASTGRIARVNHDDLHACQFGFVFNLGPQVCESPAQPLRAVGLANRSPRVDAGQFFDGNPAIRVFGFLDDGFTDLVIQVFGKIRLFATAFLEQPSRLRRMACSRE